MKILFLGFASSNHTKKWVNSLSKKGHEVLLVCQPDNYPEDNAISPNVKIHFLKYKGKLGYFLNAKELRELFEKFKPDVVNAHFASGYATTARLANVKPLVVSCWGSDVYAFPYKSFVHKWILEKNLEYADAIASTSMAMARQTQKFLADKNKKIYITPFGVDTELFKKNINSVILKNNKEKIFKIGIVKYLEPIYDIELLVKSFSIVRDKFKGKVKLEIYGSGPLKEQLINLTIKLKIREEVSFYDSIPNECVPEVLNQFDVFVNCSLQESFGVAVVEAMSCEVPVVVTDTPGYREIVTNNKNGIVLKTRNPEEMANSLVYLLENTEIAKEFAREGRKTVLEKYDWNKNMETMLDAYRLVAMNKKFVM